MAKFTYAERSKVKSLVAELSLKRIPDRLILQHIENKTGKSITRTGLFKIRQSIKRDSAKWYEELRQGEFDFLHEFKERINEIMDLQRMHHEIILRNDNKDVYRPSIIQSSLAELHRLNITLSNYISVAPNIVNGITVSAIPETKTEYNDDDIIV